MAAKAKPCAPLYRRLLTPGPHCPDSTESRMAGLASWFYQRLWFYQPHWLSPVSRAFLQVSSLSRALILPVFPSTFLPQEDPVDLEWLHLSQIMC